MALSMSDFDAILKQYYISDKVINLAERENPFFAMVKKDTSAGGRNIPLPVQFRNAQRVSGDPAVAFSTSSVGKDGGYEDFVLTRVQRYQSAVMTGEVISSAITPKSAFAEARIEIDGALSQLGNRIAQEMYRRSGGAIGKIGASTTLGGATLILDEPADAFNFEKGQTLVLSTANGGGSQKAGTLVVAGVDHDSGALTTTGNITAGVATAALGDFVFLQGDYDECIAGLADWLPDTAPGATPFFGVDRSQNVNRLGGIRLDASGLAMNEALEKMASRLMRHGASPSHVFMNHERVSDLSILLGSQVVRSVSEKGRGRIGFDAMEVFIGGRPVKVVGDVNCPVNRAYMLTLDTWCLYSAGPAPKILDLDGKYLRVTDADSYQVRMGAYVQLGCRAPGYNGVILL